jgi:hypothetical protein
MNTARARQLLRQVEDGLNRLETALFGADEAEVLGLDESTERGRALSQLTRATDALLAFAKLDVSAEVLLEEVKSAVEKAKARPFDVVDLPPVGSDDCETEVYQHPLVLRDLQRRIAAIYSLDLDQLELGLTAAQGHLLTICRNVAVSIQEMVRKNLIQMPRGEHQVKHLLFAIVRASFADAIPDGSIAFAGQFQQHKPDFGVPRLKCCVETKIARNRNGMSSAIDGIIADQSTYGSDQYNTFIGLIYSSDASLTQELLDQEIEERRKKGGEPSYAWHWVLVHGPLALSNTPVTTHV